MTVEKLKPKQLLRPITTGPGSAMNKSQVLAITCTSLEAREKSRVHGAIGFGSDSHWLKNWRDSFEPITKRSNRNHLVTFDSHLKTALTQCKWKIVIVSIVVSRFGSDSMLLERENPKHFVLKTNKQRKKQTPQVGAICLFSKCACVNTIYFCVSVHQLPPYGTEQDCNNGPEPCNRFINSACAFVKSATYHDTLITRALLYKHRYCY